jgi:hypothetical protein
LTTSTSAGDCPPATAIFPCICEAASGGLGLNIRCSSKALVDSQMSVLLQLLDSTKGIDIAVGDNALTKVPGELSKFTEYVKD